MLLFVAGAHVSRKGKDARSDDVLGVERERKRERERALYVAII
jgi:hypothetical protein